MERTYIMIKPDGVARGLTGQIIAVFISISIFFLPTHQTFSSI